MSYSKIEDIRALLRGAGAGADVDNQITSAISMADAEIDLRLGGVCNIKRAYEQKAAAIRDISAYIAASIYLAMSMSSGQENDAPQMAKYYREQAERLISSILAGAPILDIDGNQIATASNITRAMRSYTLNYLGVKS